MKRRENQASRSNLPKWWRHKLELWLRGKQGKVRAPTGGTHNLSVALNCEMGQLGMQVFAFKSDDIMLYTSGNNTPLHWERRGQWRRRGQSDKVLENVQNRTECEHSDNVRPSKHTELVLIT